MNLEGLKNADFTKAKLTAKRYEPKSFSNPWQCAKAK